MTALISRLLAFLALLMVVLPARAAVILQYHHVSEDTPAATSVTPAQFREHLERLAAEGFRVVALDQLLERVRGGLDPREKVAAITFDDGYRSVYDNALPMLEKRGWSATIFVTTAGVREGWREMMTPEMLREVRRRGHLVANHTRSHPHMVRRRADEDEAAWRERMKEEILGAQARLEQWLDGAPPAWLAWPYGEQTPALRSLVADLGYVAFGQQTGALGQYTDWQRVPRIPINRHYADWDSLRHKVLALPLPVIAAEPDSGVTEEARPRLTLRLAGDWRGRVQCYAGGREAELDVSRVDGDTLLQVRAGSALSPGRHRYNCTAPAGEGRYYWYSRIWMRRGTEGWYQEP